MRFVFHSLLRLPWTCLFVLIAFTWACSYQSTHSLRYSRSSGEVELLTDRGVIQVDFVRGDTEARGFKWDDYRRQACWGREELDMFKPQAGIGRLLADSGFASWSYSLTVRMFGSELPGQSVFLPFWLLALVVAFPAAIEWVGMLKSWRSKAVEQNDTMRSSPAMDKG